MIRSRREILGLSAASLLATAFTNPAATACGATIRTPATGDPIDREGPHHFQLGLAAYSFRDQFKFMKGKSQTPVGDRSIDMFEFIDYCASHNVAGAELTSYFFPPDANADYFRQIKRHAFTRGVTISGTAIGNNFTSGKPLIQIKEVAAAKKWIRNAAIMGAPHIRFFAGTANDLGRNPENLGLAITALQECADFAHEQGVFIGVENHGRLTADQMLEIMNGVDNDSFGISLDTGNFESETPYEDLARCAPFAVNVQVKVMMKKPDGTKYDADLNRVGKILKEANYQGFVTLEYEENDAFDHVPKWIGELRKAIQ